MPQITVVKNALANICRGGSTTLVMLLLPPFLTKILSKDAYGTWILILQISTYISFLDFGIQTAVGRYVAHHNELGEIEERNRIISTALIILLSASFLAIIGVLVLSWQLPYLFADMPTEIHQDAQLALLCVGGSLAISLPFSVFGGVFIGFQRYDIPAWIIGSSKLAGGIFVVIIAYSSHSIVMMALVTLIINIGGGISQFLFYNKMFGREINISLSKISKSTAIRIFSFCFSLSIMTFSMILISGLDTAIIGYFDYRSIIYYSLAAGLANILPGIYAATISVILPNAAALGAKADRDALGNLLITATRYSIIILIVISLPLVLGSKIILTIWVGSELMNRSSSLLQILVLGNFIRYMGAPYATIAVAVGEQRRVVLSPLIEGVVNCCASIVLTYYYGVIGVAMGTLCGSFVSITIHFMYNLPRTAIIRIKNSSTLVSAVYKPLSCLLPAICFWWILQKETSYTLFSLIILLVANAITWLLLWRWAILPVERYNFTNFLVDKIKR
jgi:O-antigen/teichoic acid export membrane protein